MRHSGASLAPIFAILLAACGGGSDGPTPPEQPPADVGDGVLEGFTIDATRYLLAGDPLTPATAQATLRLEAPNDVEHLWMWIDGVGPTLLEREGNVFTLTIDAAPLAIGDHRVLVSLTDGGFVAGYTLSKGHALYIVTSTDWDDPDNADESLMLQEMLHANHPELLVTHLVGPYTFTDPSVSEARRAELVAWVKMMRDTHGDEIGCHIHPYCNFVEAAGVTCKTTPSTVYPGGDDTGYSVRLDAYTRDEWNMMFAEVDALWAANGMGKPTSFRAGGWTLETQVAQALADSGYLADGSPNNWMRMEEWQGLPGTTLYSWNMMTWASITDTSQPYYPSESDIDVAGTPAIPLLLLPDNGSLVDYVRGDEMIDVFTKNWPGGALAEPRHVSIGYHPPNFTIVSGYFERLDAAMTHFDAFLAKQGKGPVVYARMSDIALVWPAP